MQSKNACLIALAIGDFSSVREDCFNYLNVKFFNCLIKSKYEFPYFREAKIQQLIRKDT